MLFCWFTSPALLHNAVRKFGTFFWATRYNVLLVIIMYLSYMINYSSGVFTTCTRGLTGEHQSQSDVRGWSPGRGLVPQKLKLFCKPMHKVLCSRKWKCDTMLFDTAYCRIGKLIKLVSAKEDGHDRFLNTTLLHHMQTLASPRGEGGNCIPQWVLDLILRFAQIRWEMWTHSGVLLGDEYGID